MEPTTRCKFRVQYVKHLQFGQTEVHLQAVYPDPAVDGYKHDENHAFFNATPTGQLTMLIQNPYGAELFQAGDDYYLDFTRAAKPEPADATA